MMEMSVYVSRLLVGAGRWVGRRSRLKIWAGWSGAGWSGSSSTREN